MGVWIKWFGCPKAFYEAKKVEERFGPAKSPKSADFCFIYTCAVKGEAEKKSIAAIKDALKTCKKVIVSGCLVDLLYEELRKRFPKVEFIRTKDLFRRFGIRGDYKILGPAYKNRGVAVVPIAEGCRFKCTYCATKFARGNLISYPPGEIIKAIKVAIDSGRKIIWLSAEDVASYDFYGEKIGDLLLRIANELRGFEDRVWIRIGMGNPLDFWKNRKKIIEAFESGLFFKMLHIPIQSGSRKILRLMGRAGTLWPYRAMVRKLRKFDPNFGIWTDIIAGFPGETEEDFVKTLELLEKTMPDKINISAFSARPYTVASRLEEDFGIPERIKKERTRILAGLAARIFFERKRHFLGRDVMSVIEESGGSGRDRYYTNVVFPHGMPGEVLHGRVWCICPGYLRARDK